MYKIIKISLLSLLIIPSLASKAFTSDTNADTIEIPGYNKTLKLNNIKVIKINKGDNPQYKNIDFDDETWKKISLPSSWSKIYKGYTGVCWYRFYIKFPETLPEKTMGISLGFISDTDELYFNEHLIGKSGKFTPNRKSAYDKYRLYEIPTQYIKPGQRNLLALKVEGLFPHISGPHKGNICIAPYSELQKDFFIKESIDLFFIVIYFSISIYFCFIFMVRSIDKEYIYFSLFSLATAVYLFLWTQAKYIFTDNFLLLKRIEYILLTIIFPLMLAYVTYFYKKKHTWLHYTFYSVCLISIIPMVVLNNIFAWNRIMFYIIQPSWIIPFGYAIYISVKEFKNDRNAKYILATFVIIFLTSFNDLLVYRNVKGLTKLTQYGFLMVIIGTSIILRNRFNYLYSEFINLKNKHKKPKVRLSITEDARLKLDKVMNYLHQNFMYDISREGLAENIDINPDYLGKIFKHYTNKTLNDYINELRIQKSIELIKIGEKTITEIAFEVGYENLSTFYRVFQSITGKKPTDFQDNRDKIKINK